MHRICAWLFALCCGVAFARTTDAGEIHFRVKDAGSATFKSTAQARQFAAGASTELVKLAAEKYGITLDGSDASVIPLQRLAEAVYEDLRAHQDSADAHQQRARWIELFAGYFGQLFVAHYGAHWGKTDWMSADDERALGFPRSRGVMLPMGQMQKALSLRSDLCGWYLINLTMEGIPVTPEIKACSEQGWIKSPAELELDAARAAQAKATAEIEAQARLTSRTKTEVQQGLSRAMLDMENLFRNYEVKAPARVVVSFTIAPSGEVTEAHVVSSDASDKRVEGDILARLRAMRFEARDVPEYVTPGFAVTYKHY